MTRYRPQRILVQQESLEDPATGDILHRLPGIETFTIRSMAEAAAESRDTLVLGRFPGRFLRPCQGAGADSCCGYYTVSCAWNCPFDCTYCVLQAYLTSRAMVVFTNIEDLLAEVGGALRRSPGRLFRIGTGELADSLALDDITCFSRRLVPFFASLDNGILELKTKSDQIWNLEGLNHLGRTVVAWSMNSRSISETEEPAAPSFDERLRAALRCQGWGYRLAFHFDPMVYYEGWEAGYREVVGEIFGAVDPGRVAWVSLGALRFTHHLREMVRRRFPHSKIPYGEFVPGHHGKLRYFRPIREEMYRKMKSWILDKAPGVSVYLCMESRAVLINS